MADGDVKEHEVEFPLVNKDLDLERLRAVNLGLFEKNLSNAHSWDLEQLPSPSTPVTIESRSVEGVSWRAWRAQTVIRTSSPTFVVHHPLSYASRSEWDKAMCGIELVRLLHRKEDDGRETRLIWMATEAHGLISAREFVDISIVEPIEDGVMVYGQSVRVEGEDDAAVKKLRGKFGCGDVVVGDNIPGCGWKFSSIEKVPDGLSVTPPEGGAEVEGGEEEKLVLCQYVILSDLRGWLPSQFVNMAMVSTLNTFFTRLATASTKK